MAGLVLVLAALSGFALWSSHATLASSRHAIAASALAGRYETAGKAVIDEQSLERQSRLDPRVPVAAAYEKAETTLTAAIIAIDESGSGADRTEVDRLLADQNAYQLGIDRLSAALSRHDAVGAARIERDEVNPPLLRIEQTIAASGTAQNAKAARALASLQRLERLSATATPVVFAVGLALIAMFGAVLARVRNHLRAQGEAARHDSLHDSLTGLANRALLSDCLDNALHGGQRAGTPTALLLLDLDRFKDVNDTLGHHCGDQLLTLIGPRLRAALREEDTVARLGGDEFAVLLPRVADLDAAVLVADKLRRALSRPFRLMGLDLDVEASIGVVLSGLHGDDASTLLQHADIAMYVAKKQDIGVFTYEPRVDGHSPDKLTMLSDLRRALDRHELVLVYQPKISLSTGEACGVEALLRWPHPQRGLIPPDEFIPLAERTGLIGPLTDYVLNAALTQVRAWADEGDYIPVAVNLSARNLLDPRLADKITALLRIHGVSADLLELEVTETAIMTEPVRSRAMLTQLHGAGIRVAVDDFGVGYTSLAQLKTLPVTELKIDRSFVTTMDTDEENAHIVASIIDLSHNLGMTAVAEGVETDAVLTALDHASCDVAQGYHICRPVPAAQLITWYRNHRIARQESVATRHTHDRRATPAG